MVAVGRTTVTLHVARLEPGVRVARRLTRRAAVAHRQITDRHRDVKSANVTSDVTVLKAANVCICDTGST